jgi:phage shock protein A
MSSQAEVEHELARLKGISAPHQPEAIEAGPDTGDILDAEPEKQDSAAETGKDA